MRGGISDAKLRKHQMRGGRADIDAHADKVRVHPARGAVVVVVVLMRQHIGQ